MYAICRGANYIHRTRTYPSNPNNSPVLTRYSYALALIAGLEGNEKRGTRDSHKKKQREREGQKKKR